MKFRVKLLLAMLGVVVLVTVTALVAARARIQQAYQSLFARQFQGLLASERQVRETRLRETLAKVGRFSSLVRLQALLRVLNEARETGKQRVMAEAAEKLYKNALDELSAPASEGGGGVRERLYLRLLDTSRNLIPPSKGLDVGTLDPGPEKAMEAALRSVLLNNAQNSSPRVGLLPVVFPDGGRRVLETILSPIVDPVDGSPLGALVLAFPYQEESPGTGVQAPRTQLGVGGGIWVSDAWFPTGGSPSLETALPGALLRLLGPTEAWKDSPDGVDLGEQRVFLARLPTAPGYPKAWQITAFGLEESREASHRIALQLSALGVVVLAFSAVVAGFLARGLSGPVQSLVEGTAEIARGNMGYRVKVRSQDEMGKLTAAFNEMAEGLAQKEKFRSLLNLVADPKVAEQLIHGQAVLGGEEREVSVLFCDIRGFTPLTAGMPPGDVIHLLNDHFAPLTRVVYEHDGVVDKFVGDLIMAIFGAPRGSDHDARNALLCAARMVEVREALNREGKTPIRVGIGIATGRVVAGCMGSGDRLNYTVLGERVNLAARLCSKAGAMEIVFDEDTARRAGTIEGVEALPPAQLKGFSTPVACYGLKPLLRKRLPVDVAQTIS